MSNYLCQTRHQVVVRCIGQVVIEPTLLDMDTVRVDHFAAGTGRVGEELGMRDK